MKEASQVRVMRLKGPPGQAKEKSDDGLAAMARRQAECADALKADSATCSSGH